MSTYKRLPRQIKKTKRDEFVSAVDRFLHFVLPYKRFILVAALVLIIGGLGALFFRYYQKEHLLAFNRALFLAEKASDPRVAFKELTLLQDGSSKLLYVAHLNLAKQLIEKDDYQPAALAMHQALETAPSFLNPVLRLSEAKLWWQMGDAGKALSLIEDLSKNRETLTEDHPLFLKALILEEKGDRLGAHQTYEKLALDSQNFELKKQAKDRMLLLEMMK